MAQAKDNFIYNYSEHKNEFSKEVQSIVDTLLAHPSLNVYQTEIYIMDMIHSLAFIYPSEAQKIELMFRKKVERVSEIVARENKGLNKGLQTADVDCPTCPDSVKQKVMATNGLSGKKATNKAVEEPILATKHVVTEGLKKEVHIPPGDFEKVSKENPSALQIVRAQLDEKGIRYDKRVTNVEKLLELLPKEEDKPASDDL